MRHSRRRAPAATRAPPGPPAATGIFRPGPWMACSIVIRLMSRARLAADIGGTFTDVVLEHAGRRHSAKVLTTPRAPEEGMLEGISRVLKDAALQPADIGVLVH